MYFKGKTIWITGASSGAGEALVYAMNERGSRLIISSRRKEELERVKANCTNKTAEIIVIPVDLEKPETLFSVTQEVLEKVGKVDILWHNGGMSQRSTAQDTIFEVDKKLMNINYFGAVALTKAILPTMLKNRNGQIVVMSSLTGKFGTPLRSAYAASKHALHGFFDSLRAEVYDAGLRVTIICSGYIKTEIAKNALIETGDSQKTNDPGIENGMNPKVFAEKALKAVENQKEELILGGKERFGVYIKRFAPRLFSKIIRKQNVR